MSGFRDEYWKNCPYCEKRFEANRINQKYCSSFCKYTFNNRKREGMLKQLKPINNILAKNYNILKSLLKKNKEKGRYSYETLSKLGFSFRYFTRKCRIAEREDLSTYYNLAIYKEQGKYGILELED